MEPQRNNPWMISTLVLAGLVVGYGLSTVPFPRVKTQSAVVKGQEAEAKKDGTAAQNETPPASRFTQEQIAKLSDDDAIFGDLNAPVTIVEFSDFECSFCAKFVREILPALEENYIKTGKVKLAYRDFPLSPTPHPSAPVAAEAAECAREQNKFREMHDLLFAEQVIWSASTDIVTSLKSYGAKLGLDAKEFSKCLDEHKFKNEVSKDFVDGATIGVNSTPTFFINGKNIEGAQPFETVFRPIIEAELAGKSWEPIYDRYGRITAIDVIY